MSQGGNNHKDRYIDIAGGEGEVWQRLHKALYSACPLPQDLDPVVRNLGGQLGDHMSILGGMDDAIDDVIRDYNSAFRINDVVHAALKEKPGNGLLIAFGVERGIIKQLSSDQLNSASGELAFQNDGSPLERMLDPARGFTNPNDWIMSLQRAMNAVCQIYAGVKGTGLLISPDVVMTNYHVAKKVIDGQVDRTKIQFRFDFQTPAGGGLSTAGKDYKVVDSDDWLIGASKFPPLDDVVRKRDESLSQDRPADELDFCLLRVDGKPSEDQVGSSNVKRGHIPLPDSGPEYDETFDDDDGLYILQHPEGEPLLLDWAIPADIGIDMNQLRIVYNVNTRKGSSGSPIFNPRFELVGLHHSGGKDFSDGVDEGFLFNQGIPIDKIRAYMQNTTNDGEDQTLWEKVYGA